LTLHKYTGVLVLANIQRLVAVLILEKVIKLLVVNLQKRAINRIALHIVMHHLLKAKEQVFYGPGNNPELVLVEQEWVSTGLIFRVEATR
jgi:hypothetical protein